jgi:hypothetical protein
MRLLFRWPSGIEIFGGGGEAKALQRPLADIDSKQTVLTSNRECPNWDSTPKGCAALYSPSYRLALVKPE